MSPSPFRLLRPWKPRSCFPIIFGIAFALALPAQAEVTWETVLVGDYNEEGRAVLEVAPGEGYIVAGHTTSWGPGTPDTGNPFLARLDANGTVLWYRAYGDDHGEYGFDVARDPETGGYVICAQRVIAGINEDGLLIKTDENGNEVWSRTYGTPGYDVALAITSSRLGGYLVAGATTPGLYQPNDAWLFKVGTDGTVLWSQSYGGSTPETARALVELPDGSIVLCVAGPEFTLIKTDPQGNVIWERSHMEPNWLWPRTMTTTSPDDGFAVIGTATDAFGRSDIVLLKIDSMGELEWTRQYNLGLSDVGEAIRQAEDGGFVICGGTHSRTGPQADLLLLRTDALGNFLWARKHRVADQRYTEVGYGMRLTADGGIVATGSAAGVGPGMDIYVLKTDADGRLDVPGMEAVASAPEVLRPRVTPIPNPFIGWTSAPGRGDEWFVVYDVSGRVAGSYRGERIGSDLAPGVYFVKPRGKGEETWRVVKTR